MSDLATNNGRDSGIGNYLPDLSKKSLLFEIVNKNNVGEPEEAFVLTIPPESINLEEGQRVNREKTWGGLFVDDYGPDNPKLTIAGNTGGASLRRTYAKDKRSDYEFNGKSAFFYLRDRIARYKDGRDHEKYELYMYDLSTLADFNSFRDSVASELVEGYILSLEKFKMTRSKEKPLFFNYNIETIVLRILGTNTNEVKPVTEELNELTISDILIQLRKAFNTIQSVFSKIRSVKDKIESASQMIGQVQDKIVSFFNQELDILSYPISLSKTFLTEMNDVTNTVKELDDDVLYKIKSTESDVLNMLSILNEMTASAALLVVYGKTFNATGNERIVNNSALSRSVAMRARFEDLTEESSEISATPLSSEINENNSLTVYGYTMEIATGATTLESLAAKYYGNPAMLDLIAVFNGLAGDDDIIPGAHIKIPTVLQGGSRKGNLIYSEDFRDVYGADIRIDNKKMIIASSGDLAVIEGPDNYVQALNNRLNTTLGSRLRLTVYGIKNRVGGSNNIALGYILVNIKDTVKQDPRTDSVDNIKVTGNGDKLYISFEAKSIKVNDVIPFSGGI